MTRYFIFHNNGQVEAMQSSDNAPAETAWESTKGYSRLEVTKAQFATIDRDTKITLDKGDLKTVTASVNTVQPVKSATEVTRSTLETKLDADTITFDEVKELLRLR